ncbi:MAG: hypothetical protein JRI68_19250, partial [Deltaproteobacteria bacterium]|nr:hypothetical protein [Deltaproteobacteria bacterium]
MPETTNPRHRTATPRRPLWWIGASLLALGGCTAMAGLDGDYVVGDTGSGSGTGGASSGTGGSSTSTSGEGGSGATSSSGSGGEGASTSSGSGGEGASTSSGTGGTVFDNLDTGDVQLYYGQGTSNVPLLRTWDASTTNWLAPEPTVAAEAPIRWVVTPERLGDQHLVGVLSVPGGTQLDILRNHSGTWNVDWQTKAIAAGNANRRGFDIAYETNSGEALVVYADNTGNPKYRSLVGGSWTAEAPVLSTSVSGVVQWIDLVARRPNSNEVALLFSDSARDLYAVIWDGSSWVARENLETHLHTIDYLAFGAAYEWSSGDLLMVWGYDDPNIGGAVGFYTATKAAGSNNFQYLGIASTPLLRPGPIRLRSNRSTDRIACAYVEFTCNGATCDDFIGAIWSGSQWTEAVRIDSYIDVAYN